VAAPDAVAAFDVVAAPDAVAAFDVVQVAEAAPVAAPVLDTSILLPLAAQAWVVILRGDTGSVATWHVDPGLLEYYQAQHPDAEPALKIVGMQSSWEEVERHELDLPVAAPTGLQALPSLASAPWIRAALGVRVGKTFRPLVIGIEASADGITFRPYGVTAQFAQTALERARSMARPD